MHVDPFCRSRIEEEEKTTSQEALNRSSARAATIESCQHSRTSETETTGSTPGITTGASEGERPPPPPYSDVMTWEVEVTPEVPSHRPISDASVYVTSRHAEDNGPRREENFTPSPPFPPLCRKGIRKSNCHRVFPNKN